jgi:hypothetical protein
MKIYLLTVIIGSLLITFTTYPQQYRWAKGIGGTGNDRGGGITVDKYGNVYIVGIFRGTNVDFDPGTGNLLLSSNGGDDTFFAKYDSSGNCLWAKSIGGTNDDIGMRILVDETGNVYIAGWFGSIQVDFDPGPGTHILSAEAITNIWFAKYNNDGNFIWAYSMGGNWMAAIHDISFDQNGLLLSAGYFCGTNVNFNPKPDPVLLSSIGNSGDIFFAKYDTSGACIFAKSCGGSNYEVANTIRTDLSGSIYIFGPFKSTVDFDPGIGTAALTSAGNFDIFFAKYSQSGDYLWAKRIGGTGLENSGGLVLDGNGHIYLSACFSGVNIDFDPGTGTSLLNSNGGTDICLANYDADGNYLWAGSIGGTADDNPVSTSLDSQNNIYQSGLFRGQNVDFDPGPGVYSLSSSGGCDIYFARYNSSGSIVWATATGGTSDDFSSASVTDTSGHFFITGAFSGLNIDFDPGVGAALLSSNGASDIFFAKYSKELNPIVSVDDNTNIPNELHLFQNYPNPFNPSTKISYSIPEISLVTLKVFDIIGNEIETLVNEEKPIGSYTIGFDATGLSSGIYFYKLTAGSFVETKKMILIK